MDILEEKVISVSTLEYTQAHRKSTTPVAHTVWIARAENNLNIS